MVRDPPPIQLRACSHVPACSRGQIRQGFPLRGCAGVWTDEAWIEAITREERQKCEHPAILFMKPPVLVVNHLSQPMPCCPVGKIG